MLNFYTGYNLKDVKTNQDITFSDLHTQEEIFSKVENLIKDTQAFKSGLISLKSNNPLVLEIISTLAMEEEANKNFNIFYIDKKGDKHKLYYNDRGELNDYPEGFQSVSLMVRNRFYKAVYDKMRTE